MKRILALALAAMMLLSLGTFASAEDYPSDYPEMGFSLDIPEEFSNTKGIFLPFPFPTSQDGVYQMMFNYYAFSKAESDEFNEKAKVGGLSAEDTARILNAQGILLVLLGIDGNRSVEDLIAFLETEDFDASSFTEVGKHGDITYYAVTNPDIYSDYVEGLEPEYAEEFLALQASLVDVLKNAEYYTPRSAEEELMGKVLRFETVDIDGNTVKSEELFEAHAVTMLNIWATWCGPCKSEMAELGETARSLEADGKDAAIVGVCSDADEEPELCKEILAERNVEYLNILPYEEMMDSLGITTLPTTLFVGRDGTILLTPIKGVPSDLSQYTALIDAFLASFAPDA